MAMGTPSHEASGPRRLVLSRAVVLTRSRAVPERAVATGFVGNALHACYLTPWLACCLLPFPPTLDMKMFRPQGARERLRTGTPHPSAPAAGPEHLCFSSLPPEAHLLSRRVLKYGAELGVHCPGHCTCPHSPDTNICSWLLVPSSGKRDPQHGARGLGLPSSTFQRTGAKTRPDAEPVGHPRTQGPAGLHLHKDLTSKPLSAGEHRRRESE